MKNIQKKTGLKNKKGFLLCAGKGTRFYPHTHVLPKVLLPFLNIPLASYNLYLLKHLGVNEWAANGHVHSELLKDKLIQQAAIVGMEQAFFSHEEKLLGSAGGLLKLNSFFETEEHFFYLNGDSFISPRTPDSLSCFYSSHVESGALASFLVKPTRKTKGVVWADRANRICSFLRKPADKPDVKPYDFSGLAVFSSSVFKEIKHGSVHIFKDVLEFDTLKSHLQIYSVPDMQLLDMNQLSAYLKSTEQALSFLQQKKEGCFLRRILNCFSPQWDFFKGDNYFSATQVKTPPENKKDILFCGGKVQGLDKLSVKNFAVLGNHSSVTSCLYMNRSVLAEGVSLSTNIRNSLVL